MAANIALREYAGNGMEPKIGRRDAVIRVRMRP